MGAFSACSMSGRAQRGQGVRRTDAPCPYRILLSFRGGCGYARAMRAVRARTVVITPELVVDDGFVAFEGGRIAASGPWSEASTLALTDVQDLGEVAIAAPVFNMHAHLELSHLAGRTTGGLGFTEWVASLIRLPREAAKAEALDAAVAELVASGTAWVLDICGMSPGPVAAALDRAGLGYTLGVEFFGHAPLPDEGDSPNAAASGPADDPADSPQQAAASGALPDLPWPPGTAELSEAQWAHVAAAGHALYSTGASTLRAAKAWSAAHGRPFSLHLAEHEGEDEVLMCAAGPFADLLKKRVLPSDFTPPRLSSVAYADSLGLIDASTLAVHCVRVGPADIELLARRGASVCLCPRSNEFINVGRAPWAALRDAGLNLCLGTDSLTSNTDLNVWSEAAYILDNADGAVGFADVMAWLTVNPARFLGLENTHGTLESGKLAGYSIVPDGLMRG